MLQPNLNHPIRFLRSLQTLLCLSDRPCHRLFAIEVFASGDRVQEVSRVHMQRTGNDDAIDILHIKQTTVVIESLNTRSQLLGFASPP